jgi:hypothetical protein
MKNNAIIKEIGDKKAKIMNEFKEIFYGVCFYGVLYKVLNY